MTQSRLSSLVEASLNIGSGFILSLVIWQTVGPLFGYAVTMHDNLAITSVFTVASLGRSYLWRRYFNYRLRGFYERRESADEAGLAVGDRQAP